MSGGTTHFKESGMTSGGKAMNGAEYRNDVTAEFAVWAPERTSVALRLLTEPEAVAPMERKARGYWRLRVPCPPGTRYMFVLDGRTARPDPASSHQPLGVHGPSEVVDHGSYPWRDGHWRGVDLEEMVIYEIHTGTFTPEGTFDAVIPRLPALKELGVNTLELMPVSQFPGGRNWGYDGAYPFAAQNTYGGPEGLRRLVEACHLAGMAVLLDVVFNHFGPEGNYTGDYGPYATDRFRTPWGNAINFDGPHSDQVRRFFIDCALHWLTHFHIDGLRLDAVHSMHDESAAPFLRELAEEVARFSRADGRRRFLVAESDLNDSRLVRSKEAGGFGLDAVWCDDFHHSLHALLTGEKSGYYEDFGQAAHYLRALRNGFVYCGEYSGHRKRRHGNWPGDLPPSRFVVFSQNHDQVGNRMEGERLASLVSLEALKLAAGAVILSPSVPLLFMGEEYGERAPFLYFTSHSDADLIDGVRRGRTEEFAAFAWKGEPPDPQDGETFLRSTLRWEARDEGTGRLLREFYRRLLALRRRYLTLLASERHRIGLHFEPARRLVFVHRERDGEALLLVQNFDDRTALAVAPPQGAWKKLLDSSDAEWGGPGALLPLGLTGAAELSVPARSFALYAAGERRSDERS